MVICLTHIELQLHPRHKHTVKTVTTSRHMKNRVTTPGVLRKCGMIGSLGWLIMMEYCVIKVFCDWVKKLKEALRRIIGV